MSNRSTSTHSPRTGRQRVRRGPELTTLQPAPYDLLTDVMDQVRLEATVYFVLETSLPCAISIARPGRSPFYAITSGSCRLVLGRKVYELNEGDFVLLPSGAPHVMRCTDDAPPIALDDWMQLHAKTESCFVRIDGPGPTLRMTGGFFSF